MGNRAVICTEKRDLELYLHWNGGRDSVAPFLEYCRRKGYRPPEQDGYGWARLCQVVGNFIGGNHSVGIDPYGTYDLCFLDNGRYVIKNWEIIGREGLPADFVEQDEYDFEHFIESIDLCMMPSERLSVGSEE